MFKMSTERLTGLPTKPCDPVPLCADHGRRTCYQCLHSINCAPDGQHDANLRYATKDRPLHPAPLRGLNALFIPQLDAHLGLSAGVGSLSNTSNGLYAQEVAKEDLTVDFTVPPAVAPSEGWFHFCQECSLTWLSGHDGPTAAANHPSHTALRDKRTLVAWIGTKQEQTAGCTNHSGVVSFGQDSRYNHTINAASEDEAILSAAQHCLDIVHSRVHQDRIHLIEKYVRTNSDTFLEKAKMFRFVIVVSEPAVHEFFSGLGCWFFHRQPYQVYRTNDGLGVPLIQKFNYGTLRVLELSLEELARTEIMVKWYLIHPSMNRAMINSEQRLSEARPLPAVASRIVDNRLAAMDIDDEAISNDQQFINPNGKSSATTTESDPVAAQGDSAEQQSTSQAGYRSNETTKTKPNGSEDNLMNIQHGTSPPDISGTKTSFPPADSVTSVIATENTAPNGKEQVIDQAHADPNLPNHV
jgi:hypothetical protein